MDRSVFLSRVIGIYMLVVSVAMLINMSSFVNMINELVSNKSIMFLSGFFTLIIGILLVVSHNVWRWNWSLLITIIAWIVFIKAISLIFFPHILDTLTTTFVQNSKFAYGCAIFDFVVGIILLFQGYRHCKKP